MVRVYFYFKNTQLTDIFGCLIYKPKVLDWRDIGSMMPVVSLDISLPTINKTIIYMKVLNKRFLVINESVVFW